MQLIALEKFPLVAPGDDLPELIVESLRSNNLSLENGDTLVIAQKVVSKAENRYAYLNEVEPSSEAIALAEQVLKDPREVELILRESTSVIRHRPGVLIVRHRHGYVHANAGIDKSNIQVQEQNPRVLLLPENPDQSAQKLKDIIQAKTGVTVNIIINDSAGRAWRMGTTGFALGTAGFEPLVDKVGDVDLFGRPLQTTQIAVADELASAASFIMGQAAEGLPVVLVRGAQVTASREGSQSLIRPAHEDLFL